MVVHRAQGREQDRSEVDDVNVVDSMEFWDFEFLFETTKFVDDRLPGVATEIKNEIINDIYDNLYDLVKEIHEREGTKKEG